MADFLKGLPVYNESNFSRFHADSVCKASTALQNTREQAALRLPPHKRIPFRPNHSNRKNKYTLALPPPTVGQKECCKEKRPRPVRNRRDIGTSTKDCPDRQSRNERRHIGGSKNPPTFQFTSPFFLHCSTGSTCIVAGGTIALFLNLSHFCPDLIGAKILFISSRFYLCCSENRLENRWC